jgi:hypothetical protein
VTRYYEKKNLPEEKELLPIMASNQPIEEDEMCGICMLEFEQLQPVKQLDCKLETKHMYHYDCLLAWFNKKLICPMCRFDFNKQCIDMRKKTQYQLI